jgi:phage tail-like protein
MAWGDQPWGSSVWGEGSVVSGTIRSPIGALFIDNLRFDNEGGIALFNQIPQHNESGVKDTSTINLWVAAFAGELTDVLVYVTRDGTRTLAYDQAGTGIQSGWDGNRADSTVQVSPAGTVDDELILVLDPTTPFTSEDSVIVEVLGSAGPSDLHASYTFYIEDTSPPKIDEIVWVDPRNARLRFTKEMQCDDRLNGILYSINISGAFEIVGPNTLVLTSTMPTVDLVDYWLGMTGSAYPVNNDYYQVKNVNLATREIELDMPTGVSLVSDTGVDTDADGNIVRRRTLRGFITSYRIEARPQDEAVEHLCSYAPMVVGSSLRKALPTERPSDVSEERYLFLEFHDDVSIERMYRFHVARAKDESKIAAADASTFDFTTPRFGSPVNRITMLETMPYPMLAEDLDEGGQFHKLACVLQDGMNVLWRRADMLEMLNDPDTAPQVWIDFLLYSMGNPFRVPLADLDKRRLISALVSIYKQIGTEKVIKDTLAFFLGITFDIRTFIGATGWTLGTSIIGVNTALAAGSKLAKNSYEIISPVNLTDEQRRIVRDVAEFLDPLYMHLVRIVEPGDFSGTLLFWTIGSSALGSTTTLSP